MRQRPSQEPGELIFFFFLVFACTRATDIRKCLPEAVEHIEKWMPGTNCYESPCLDAPYPHAPTERVALRKGLFFSFFSPLCLTVIPVHRTQTWSETGDRMI